MDNVLIKLIKSIRGLKPFGIAIIAFLLYLIEKDYLNDLFSKVVLPFTDVESSIPLAILTIIFIIVSLTYFYLSYKRRRILSLDFQAWILFFTLIYLYNRLFDETYDFTACVGSLAFSDSLLIWPAYTFLASCKFFSKKKVQEGNKYDKQFTDDNPIKSKKYDVLNFGASVNKAISYISGMPVDSSSFSIAITGKWGEGKTSFINILKEELTKRRNFIIVDFYPRQSKTKENIQRDLLLAIRQELSKYHAGIGSLMEYYIRALNLAKDFIPVISIFEQPTIEESKGLIEEALSRIGKKLIVFIDDTDRLTGEEIIEVLKLIDKNAAFRNTIFVTAMDKLHFDKSINSYFRNGNEDNFADKYFAIEITLPQQPTYKRRDMLKNLLYKAIDNGNITITDKNSIDRLIKNTSYFIDKYLLTIRDVKRFVNQFVYDYETIQDDVVLWDYFLVSLIKYKYKQEYENLRDKEYVEMGTSLFGSDDNDELIFLKESICKVEDNTNDNAKTEKVELPESLDILKRLFPLHSSRTENWYNERSNRIYNKASFDFYFYDYESTHLRRDNFVKLFELDYQSADIQLKSWFDYGYEGDISSFFLTRNILTFGSLQHLELFFKLLLSCNYYSKSFNFHIFLNYFFENGEVSKILKIKQYNIPTKDKWLETLKVWLIDTIPNNPLIASKYILACYSTFVDDPGLIQDYAYSIEDYRDMNVSLFNTYMGKIEMEKWEVDYAIQLGLIPVKDKDVKNRPFKRDAEAFNIMEHYINQHPEKFINRFVTHYYETLGKGNAKLVLNPQLKDILENGNVIERALNGLKRLQGYNDENTLKFIELFWKRYKSNNMKGISVKLNARVKNYSYDAYYKALTR